jgi:hypothetical protein
MKADREVSFKIRLAIFMGLWIAAGLICAVFAELDLEEGVDEFAIRSSIAVLIPFYAASDLALILVPGGYRPWERQENGETLISCILLFLFAVHATISLTRKSRKQFQVCSAIQVMFLAAGVSSVLYYYHWDTWHMHA